MVLCLWRKTHGPLQTLLIFFWRNLETLLKEPHKQAPKPTPYSVSWPPTPGSNRANEVHVHADYVLAKCSDRPHTSRRLH